MDLVDEIEVLTRDYWTAWAKLKQDEGWKLGPDRGDLRLSPYLVHDFDGLSTSGKQHFRQQVALVVMQVLSSDHEKARARALLKLDSAQQALEKGNLERAKRKIRTANKLLQGLPITPKKPVENT